MKNIKEISSFLSEITTVNETYIYLFIRTVIFILIVVILQHIALKIIKRIKDSKKEYIYSQRVKVFSAILKTLIVILALQI